MNVIFTCGGTGGHINPAIAVANILKQRKPDCKILFIGAQGHMEEKLVPAAGFELVTLPGSGLSSSAAYEVLVGTIINALFFENKRCRQIQFYQIRYY